jgi:putative colanic acid biosynthesis glycosyltransferase WcaI
MIATRLADALARRGHDVWVGTTWPWYRPTAELLGPREKRVTVLRSRPAVGRFRTYISYHLAIVRWSAAVRAADVIVSMSPPLTVGTLASLVGTGRPTVYNTQDIFPEVVRRTGQLGAGPLVSLLEVLERFTYSRTSAVVTVGESQRRFLIKKGVPADKVITIENFADLDEIAPRPTDLDYRRALGIADDAFLALYAGNFGLVNDLDLILEAIDSVTRKNVVFLLAGAGREWHRAVEFAKLRSNLVIIGHRPASELPRLYAAADVGLLTLKRNLSDCSVPSKTYTILASGRPFIAAIDQDSDIASIARVSGAGLVVPPGDARQFAAQILELASDRSRSVQMGESGYRYVLENNSASVAAERYEKVFKRIISDRRRGPRPFELSRHP